MQGAKTSIENLGEIDRRDSPLAYRWSPSCGPGTPQYLEATRTIMAIARAGEYQRALALAALFEEAFPRQLEPAVFVARLHFDAGETDKAIALLQEVREIGEKNAAWLSLRAACAFAKADAEESRAWSRRYKDAVPSCFLSPRRTDLPLVGVVNIGPQAISQPDAPKYVHFSGNYISQLAHSEPARYRFMSIFADSANAGKAQTGSPRPDVVVNNVVNGEILGDRQIMMSVSAALDKWKRPVINGPKDAMPTARDKLYQQLKDAPGLIAPKTVYFDFSSADEDLVRRIEAEFEYPVIVRSPFFQFGGQMYLARSREELLTHLRILAPGCFVIQFVENQRRAGLYCKMRAIFVGERLHMCRVDYLPQWKVHAARFRASQDGVRFFEERPYLREEEAAVCADPAKELGKTAMKALRHIRSVIKLDCFGIDFDITKTGELLLFEANASMNFIGNKPKTLIRHPDDAEQAMIQNLYRMLDARIAGRVP